MKSKFILFIIISLFYSFNSMSQISDSLSYSLGVLIGENLKQQGFTKVNTAELATAIGDVYTDSAQVNSMHASKIVQKAQKEMSEAKFGAVKEEGIAFLEENGKRPEVVTLESGLQYEVLTEGAGEKPSPLSKVTTHYHGMLIDGSVFDSSVDRNQPATFPINGVIKGWQEILPMMPVGSKWKVFIPQELAYGSRGAGNDIPPFATLIFEIELLSFE